MDNLAGGSPSDQNQLIIPDDASSAQQLRMLTDEFVQNGVANLAFLLPAFLSLKGKPFSVENYPPVEPLYSTTPPRAQVIQAGRQISKTTTLSAQALLEALTSPYKATLIMTPLFEMIRRISSTFVRPFIYQSPVKRLLLNTQATQRSLHRVFRNESSIHFSFASLSADRIRGLPCDRLKIDEAQDFNSAFLPEIVEVLSGSDLGTQQFTGTAKTRTTLLHECWEKSSQAHWAVRCGCGYENIAARQFDLDAMTGPSFFSRDISRATPGLVCAKCGHPLQPREGCWRHTYPERRLDFAGYHMPQQIFPLHYEDPIKWRDLLAKRDGGNETAYYNEVCGEAHDVGTTLVNIDELRAACDDRPNDLKYAERRVGDYPYRVLSVDWGGGGASGVSRTVMGLLGMTDSGRVDVLYAVRFKTSNDYVREAKAVLYLAHAFQCSHVVHDYGGAGAVREQLLVSAKWPLSRIVPIAYVGGTTGRPMMKFKGSTTDLQQRDYYQVDKTRSLMLTCALIRFGGLRFFRYDYRSKDQPGLVSEYLALNQERIAKSLGSEVAVVQSGSGRSDDFVQMTNIGCCALFHLTGRWPNLDALASLKVDEETISLLQDTDNWQAEMAKELALHADAPPS